MRLSEQWHLGLLRLTFATSFRGKSDGPGCDDDETSIDEPLLSAARRHPRQIFPLLPAEYIITFGLSRATFNFVINRLLSSRTRSTKTA